MPSHAAKNVLDRWIEIGTSSTGLVMLPHLSRYMVKNQLYEIEVVDKEMSDGGLTGWTYLVHSSTNKVPAGFWRIRGDGRVAMYPHNSKEVFG